MFELLKKLFIELLTGIVSASNYTKWVLSSNQKCMIQPTLINLHPNEYTQEFHYCAFAVKLDIFVESCNTLNDLPNKVCVPDKTEDLNLSVINIITRINESKTLTEHISFECKCKFNGRKCNSDQWWNNRKCRCECKKRHICEKDCVWIPATYSCANGKYLASILDNSAIMCDEVIESDNEKTKTIPTNFNEKKSACKTQNFYNLHVFLLIAITFLIAVSIYCHLIKCRAKQKHLLPFHVTHNELKKLCINNINQD